MYRQLKDKTFEFECDGLCGMTNRTEQKSFRQALNVSRLEGWEHRKSPSDSWLNLCPQCTEQSDSAAELAGIHFFRKEIDDD